METFQIMWEVLHKDSLPYNGGSVQTETARLEVPGGHLYRERHSNGSGAIAVALHFVPVAPVHIETEPDTKTEDGDNPPSRRVTRKHK